MYLHMIDRLGTSREREVKGKKADESEAQVRLWALYSWDKLLLSVVRRVVGLGREELSIWFIASSCILICLYSSLYWKDSEVPLHPPL